MAEAAAGAVTSLLRVISNEAQLLRLVWSDIRFIQEEMQSMNSFLEHLVRTAPPDAEHDEQVRTWMDQVRLLVRDCNNCIDIYLYWENPDIHLARGCLRRYLSWVYWFPRKLLAQHHAAVQLRELKDRARDVGERRIRYGVEVPGKSAATASSSARGGYEAAAADDNEEEDGDNQLVSTRPTISRTLDDYLKAKLCEWAGGITINAGESYSMVTVAPYTYQALLALVQEIWVSKGNFYQRMVLVDIPTVHQNSMPLRAKEVLFYILRELKHAKSQHQEQDPDLVAWEVEKTKWQIYSEKKSALALLKIKENIKEMKVHEKLDKIKSDIQGRIGNGDGLPKGDKLQGELDQLDLDLLLQLLLQEAITASQQDQGKKSRDMHIFLALISKKLKEHMEAKEKDKVLEEEEVLSTEEEEEEEGGEIAEHMVEGEGEVTRSTVEEVAEEIGEFAEHIVEREGGGEEIKSQHPTWIHLHEAQYAHILQNLFPKSSSSSSPLQAQDRSLVGKPATKATTTTLGEDQIKQMIQDAKEEILWKLLEAKYDKSVGTGGESGVANQNPGTVSEKISQMMEKMKKDFREQLKIKGLVEEIKKNLNDHRWYLNEKESTLFILRVDKLMDVSTSTLEDTRNALSLLNNSSDIMIITSTKENIQVAKEYCYPPREPIDYSLTGLYHDTILELISSQHQRQNNGDNCYHPQIFHDILDECEPHEFCMKIFTHALYANPKRSNEELLKLHNILQDLPTSFNNIAKVMFKFSYNDLPKEYKSCLLYLAIFPPGHKIRRSTLIGRWVAEGLTSKEDWHSSLRQANRCFDTLVDRCLIYPADIGATRNVKSCIVGEPVHGIITTIARKQHILETRLSHHLARHFSIFNGLQLRRSDGIDKFFQGLSRSSQVSALKVLDLEGCKCFGRKNQRYLKDICRKMLLLKYLSLRRTDITQLPKEINNLRELEVLDIRQTEVPPHATRSILLLKLKRLLAGHVGLSASCWIPHKIYKMVNMELLSNLKAHHSDDLQDIGKLWQLRKLGVVIDDKDSHLEKLLQTIGDLYECLRSLSITIIPVATPTPHKAGAGTPSADDDLDGIGSLFINHPKILQSLSIRGTTHKGSLLPLFMKGGSHNVLAKLTLSGTLLSQDDLKALAKLPMLRCVRFQHIACTENMLTFKKEEFICLNYLLVQGSDLTNIIFEDGSARELEKMVLSFTSTGCISGVDQLPELEELELNNSFCGRLLSSFDNSAKIAKLTLRGTEIEPDALQILTKNPNIHCLVLLDKSFGGEQNEIIFKRDEFLWLNLLVVNCSAITSIVFTHGSAPRLEKIVWSSSTCLSGINKLPRLKELEFSGAQVPDEVMKAIEKHENNPSVKLNEPEKQD